MVKTPLDLASTVLSPLLLLLLAAGGVCAAELDALPSGDLEKAAVSAKGTAESATAPDAGEPGENSAAEEPGGEVTETTPEGTGVSAAEPADEAVSQGAGEPAYVPEDERQVEVLERKGGSLGYNFVFGDDNRGRALEYGFLKSSRSGGLFYRHMEKDTNLELEGFYLNENDYHGDLLMDYRGDYRLHLRTESLYHNLDREILFSPSFEGPRTDAPGSATYSAEQDAPAHYGVSVVQDRADFRYRLHNYPLHLNLGYWRYTKEGTIQQRFADASFEGEANTVYARPRSIDQQIQEGRLGLDAHLGPVDLVYDFKIRYFEDRLPTPVATYIARNDIHGNLERLGGEQQHNENPDSRFFSHTLKLHTSLSGGLVGSASYSVDQRENLSDLSDVTGARHMKVYLQNAAGDITYTPCREYTFALKYRRQELDNGNRGALLSANFVDPLQVVKAPLETTRNLVTGTVWYRPRHDLSFVGEYRGDFVNRDNVSDLPSPTTWALPDHSATHTGSLAVYYRPFKGVRSSAQYSYASTDNPAYGASFKERQEGKLLLTYTGGRWGVSTHALIRHDRNDEVTHFVLNTLDPLDYSTMPLTSRHGSSENANVGAWWMPLPKLTVGFNYSYLHSEVEQPVFFTTVVVGSEADSRFSNSSHVYTVNVSYALGEQCDLSLMAQQIRSRASFSPADFSSAAYAGSSTAGISGITAQDTVISALSARGEYRFSRVLSTTLEYTLRDYDEKNSQNINYQTYNGMVHAIVAGLAAKW
ncbi:hypothetical protein [Geomonas oryzae]|uniref:hypothetical protein n=1 Tax=Geomonas oryzae TaxID=2364273 RepID=UPI00100A4EAA|nr:hypothetical protein [Geomonas oryzae]